MTILRPQAGFTVVEVLVGAAFAALVLLLGYSAFLVAGKMHVRWTENVTSAQQAHVQTRQMLADLRRADRLVERAGCLWLLITAYHDSVSYATKDSSLLRNEDIVHISPVAHPLSSRYEGRVKAASMNCVP